MALGITVQDVLKRYPATLSKVVAGVGGLQRNVSHVGIMDAPDILDWVKTGEFLVTTGFPLGNDVEAFEQLVVGLAKANCAALGLKVRRFWDGFPPSVISLANTLDFPLMEIPSTVTLADIADIIQNNRTGVSNRQYLGGPLSVSEFMEGLRSGHLSPAQIRFWAQQYSIDPWQVTMACEIELQEKIPIHPIIDELAEILKARILHSGDTSWNYSCLISAKILPGFSRLSEELTTYVDALPVRLFLGTLGESIFDYAVSADASAKAKRVSSFARPHAKVVFFHEVTLYAVLWDRFTVDDLDTIVEKSIGPILAYDQINGTEWAPTLYEFFRAGRNSALAAKALNTHKNTVTYRINRIEKEFGLDLSSTERLFELSLGFLCHQIRASL